MKHLAPARHKTLLASAVIAILLSACGGGNSGEGITTGSTSGTPSGNPATESSSAFAGQALSTHLGDRANPLTPQATTTPQNGDVLRAEIYTNEDSDQTASTEGPAGQDVSNYRLTLHDSFDGGLDRDVWNTSRTEDENSTENYDTSDGALRIWPERGNNGEFFDRTLDTAGKFEQQYGYFEIEAKLPKGKGVWPAFWLFNQFGERRLEIDIMEAYPGGAYPWGEADENGIPVAKMYAPVVWTSPQDRAGYAKIATPDLSADFHKYGVKWEPNKVTFYFDGKEEFALDVSINDPLYVILDVWFGSASGTPDGSTPTGRGNSFEVNYVKVWQFK